MQYLDSLVNPEIYSAVSHLNDSCVFFGYCVFTFLFSYLLISKLRDQLYVKTDLHVQRRTISRSTQHVTMRARWEKIGHFWMKMPRETPPVFTVSVLFRQPSFLCHSRHRSCISGWSPRYAWRMWLVLSCCLQVENESLAPLVTLVSITMTLPPAHHAQLGPILMEWNVLRTLNDNVYTHFSLVTLSICVVIKMWSSLSPLCSVQAVSSRHWAHLGLWV